MSQTSSPPLPPSPALQHAIARSLAVMADESEQFGVALCSDPVVAAQHLEHLQQVDRFAQALRELSIVLRANQPDAVVADIRLGDLRHELESACGVA